MALTSLTNLLATATDAIAWEAWGAIGTWVVGIAAVVLAWRAHALAQELRRSASDKEALAARVALVGLYMEAVSYASRTSEVAAIARASVDAKHPAASAQHLANRLTHFAGVKLPSEALAIVHHLPHHLGTTIGTLLSGQRLASNSASSMSFTLGKLAAIDGLESKMLDEVLLGMAEGFETSTQNVYEAARAIAKHLRIEPEDAIQSSMGANAVARAAGSVSEPPTSVGCN